MVRAKDVPHFSIYDSTKIDLALQAVSRVLTQVPDLSEDEKHRLKETAEMLDNLYNRFEAAGK